MKKCLLDEKKECNACMDCDRCDLNPDKLCDNCCKCIETDEAFLQVPIADIVTKDADEYLRTFYQDDVQEDGDLI